MISWFEKHRKLSIFITLIIAVVIFKISSMTFEASQGGTNIKALAYHFFAFVFLAMFLFISTINNKKLPVIIFTAVLLSVLYAISDELHQAFVPGRFLSLGDVFIDTLGIFYAFMVYFIFVEYRNGKRYILRN